MLRSNSKKACDNIRAYIIDRFTPENYTDEAPTEYSEICKFILDCFRNERWSRKEDYRYFKTEQNAFIDWCAGLPSVLDCCFFYNRPAVDDLGEILEESEEEKNKYTESQAEQTLAYLIYRELTKAERRSMR